MRSPLTIALLLLLCLIPLLHAQIVVEETTFDDPLIQARSNVSIEYLPPLPSPNRNCPRT